MSTFNWIQVTVLSLMDVLQYYFFASKIVNKRLVIQVRDVFYLIAAMGAAASFSNLIDGPMGYFVNALVLMALCYGLYKVRGIKLIYLHLIAAMCVLVQQLVILIAIELLRPSGIELFTMGVIAQSIGIFSAALLAWKLPLHLLLNYVDAHNRLFKVIIVNVFMLLTVCVIVWYLKVDALLKHINLFALFTAIILLINTILMQNSLKNQRVEEQNRMYEHYLPIVEGLIDEVRAKQHDFDNHIQALRMMVCQEKDLEQARKQMEDYIDDLYGEFRERDLIRLENKMVAGFLHSKIHHAKEKGIRLDMRVESSVLATELKDFEILEVLGVLIDNAFETGVPDNHVKIVIKKEKHKSVIEIFNKHPYVSTEQFQKMFSKGYSSKVGPGRGIGLYKLKALLSSGRGDLEVANCEIGDDEDQNLGSNYVAFKVTLL